VKLVLAIQNANLCDLIFLFCISEHARVKAEVAASRRDVCFASVSGHRQAVSACLKSATSESEAARNHLYDAERYRSVTAV
jgi:hypothetical protein